MNPLISNAYAQGAAGAQASPLELFLPFIILLVVFWFLLLRPQQKRQKEHKVMVEGLKKGDEVVTGGGMLGKVTKIGDSFVSIEVANGLEVRVQRMSIATLMPKGTLKSS